MASGSAVTSTVLVSIVVETSQLDQDFVALLGLGSPWADLGASTIPDYPQLVQVQDSWIKSHDRCYSWQQQALPLPVNETQSLEQVGQ